jgi:hypothetical protein
MTHILNRHLPPREPAPAAPPKPTPEQAAVIRKLKQTKAAEDVGRAIERTRR